MPNLDRLYRRRLSHWLKEVGKYGRLIFNDHFSIILFVLLGFAALIYKDLLQSILTTPSQPIAAVFSLAIGLVIAAAVSLGKPIWFNFEADRSYLFPQGRKWLTYWRKTFLLGLGLKLIWLLPIGLILYPLLQALIAPRALNLVLYGVYVGMMGVTRHFHQTLHLFHQPTTSVYQGHLAWLPLLESLILVGTCLVTPPLQLYLIGLGLVLMVGLSYKHYQDLHQSLIDFEWVIEEASSQRARFYKWVALFADVPHMKPAIRLRKWLQPLTRLIEGKAPDRYRYYLARVLTRHEAYAGVWLRVTLFSAIMLFLIGNHWLLLAIMGVIGFVLVVIQLLPVYKQAHHLVWQQLYPVQDLKQKQVALRQAIRIILWLMFCIFALINLWIQGGTLEMVQTLLVWLIGLTLLVRAYLPFWVNRAGKQIQS